MFPLPPLVPHTSVGDGGVLPTPTTKDAPDDGGPPNRKMHTKRWGGVNSLGQMAKLDLWPTPTVEGNGNRAEYSSKAGDGLETAVKRVPTPHSGMGDRGGMAERVGDPEAHQQLQDYVAKFPTPTHADSDRTSEHYGKGNMTLRGAALRLPTPKATDARTGGGRHEGERKTPNLEWVARQMLPTPTAQDVANCGAPSQMERNSPPLNALVKMLPTPTAERYGTNKGMNPGAEPRPSLQTLSGGKLNPRWVEWLMGTPEGWTSLEHLEMESYLRWLESFSWDESLVANA